MPQFSIQGEALRNRDTQDPNLEIPIQLKRMKIWGFLTGRLVFIVGPYAFVQGSAQIETCPNMFVVHKARGECQATSPAHHIYYHHFALIHLYLTPTFKIFSLRQQQINLASQM